MLEINQRYIRKSQEGEEKVVSINNEEELAYHQSLEVEGFSYQAIEPAKPIGGVCVSCEA